MTSLPDGFRVVEPEQVEHLVALVRAWLADGADHEQALDRLRRDGVPKALCVRVMQEAAGLAHGDAKLVVHNSLAWADRRATDEQLEAQFFRALFIMCVLGEGTVNEPDEDVAEWRDCQARARRLLDEIAEPFPAAHAVIWTNAWRRTGSARHSPRSSGSPST